MRGGVYLVGGTGGKMGGYSAAVLAGSRRGGTL